MHKNMLNEMTSCDLLIWDSNEVAPKGVSSIVYWTRYLEEEEDNAISIPHMLEENADLFKKRFLAWSYDLGETKLGNKTLVEHFKLRENFSYWWMTRLQDKSYAKSPAFYASVRLFALEDVIKNFKGQRVLLVTEDKTFSKVLKALCRGYDIKFIDITREIGLPRSKSSRRIFSMLPKPVQALLSLVKFIRLRWPLATTAKQNKFCSDITFIDYLFNLEKKNLKAGVFSSHYWTDLVCLLAEKVVKTNWIHHFESHKDVSTASEAVGLMNRFNQSAKGQEFHGCIEGYLNARTLVDALRDYFNLSWKSIYLRQFKKCFKPRDSKLDMWLIFKNDWLDSMRGSSAIINCLQVNLCEALCNRLPPQKLGIYLQENQPWEMAFIYAWRAAGHGKLIGVPHSTVRYWDLRYFYDARCYLKNTQADLPRPDKIAVNGPVAKKIYLDGGYPVNDVIEVEALRYLGLTELKSEASHSRKYLRVLICTDYVPEISEQMLSWLTAISDKLPSDICFKVKSHPNYIINPKAYPGLSLSFVDTSLSEALKDCDLVFTSNITSAAVDAYSCGLPVIQVLDGNLFNLSPLRGLNNLFYVRNAAELLGILKDVSKFEQAEILPYFCLDKTLPRWQKLLGLPECLDM